MKLAIVTLLTVTILAFGFSNITAYAEIKANNVFVLEGSGFAVTEELIKNTEINFVLSTGSIINGKGDISIVDGVVTLSDNDFITDNLIGNVLRDGKFLRISGTADSPSGKEISIRIFGKLIQNSEQGSIYSFTGRIVEDNISYKLLYTTQLSKFQTTNITSSSLETPSELVVHILKGSSNSAVSSSYIDSLGSSARAGYFSEDRIIIEPGTTVVFVNDDTVSHKIVSGEGLGQNVRLLKADALICDIFSISTKYNAAEGKECAFTLDGRINSGEMIPGASVTLTFDDSGLYRLIDTEYPWMNITVYSYPNVDSIIVGKSSEDRN